MEVDIFCFPSLNLIFREIESNNFSIFLQRRAGRVALEILLKYFEKCADVLWLLGVSVPKELCSLGNFSNL